MRPRRGHWHFQSLFIVPKVANSPSKIVELPAAVEIDVEGSQDILAKYVNTARRVRC